MTTTATELFDIDPLLQVMWDQGGSDLLLTGGSPPMIRVHGVLQPIGEQHLSGDTIALVVQNMLDNEQRANFDVDKDIDFAFSWREHGRLRANAFVQRGTVALELRMIPFRIPTMVELGLPPVADVGGRTSPAAWCW